MPKSKYGPPSEDAIGFPSEDQLRTVVTTLMTERLDEYMKLVETGQIAAKIPPPIMVERAIKLPKHGGTAQLSEEALFFHSSNSETGEQIILCAYTHECEMQDKLSLELAAQVQLLIHELMREVVGEMIINLGTMLERHTRRRDMLIGFYAQDLLPFLSGENRRRALRYTQRPPQDT